MSLHVNEAIEQAYRNGILTTASLMVGAPALADAVERARRLPELKVGLHVVLVCGRPVLSPGAVPDLVDRDGNFLSHLVWAGLNFFFRPSVRRQLELEIRAQFEAFRATTLPLDHVNAHHHMHLHPTVLGLILKIARDYGQTAVRVPHEPLWHCWRAAKGGSLRRVASSMLLAPWVGIMKTRLKLAQVQHNDYLFGMNNSGQMTSAYVLGLLANLPPGVSEIYFHPTTRNSSTGYPWPEYHAREHELEALIHPAVIEALRRSNIQRVTFSELAQNGPQE